MTTLRASSGVVIAIGLATVLGFTPPAHGQTWLLDFGGNSTYRSTAVVNPDVNGHYWNSIDYAYLPGMIDINGNTTPLAYGPDGAYGTDSYNGPAGDTSAGVPATIGNCVFNPTALGNLGVTNAVYDFFVDIHFQLQGLDPTKQYKLTFFGSHKYNTDDTTIYSICSDSTYSTVLTSTSLLVGSGANHNQDTVAVISGVSPQANTIMYVSVGAASGSGYLNAMQLEVIPEPSTVALAGLGILALAGLRRRRS